MQAKNTYLWLALALLFYCPATLYGASKISEKARSTIEKEIDERGETIVLVELASQTSWPLLQENIAENERNELVSDLQRRLISSLSLTDRDRIVHKYQYVPGVVMRVNNQTLGRIEKNEFIKKVYENGMRKPFLQDSIPLIFSNQEGSQFNGNNSWSVAVLDTGVDKNHSFLTTGSTSKVISEACYSRGGYSTIYQEVDSLCPNESFSATSVNSGLPCNGYSGCDHGTHVAGIAAGNGTTFNGVAPEGKIIAIQVFTGLRDIFGRNICGTGIGQNCITAFDVDILHALEKVYSLRNTIKIASVNMSLGGGEFFGSCDNQNALITQAINNLKNAGIATVIASGNSFFTNSLSFPACISNAISVGATFDSGSSVDTGTQYSNESATLDIYAPGSFILSSVPGGGFSVKQGTSMAAPHVAGAWAVMKHASPEASVNMLENLIKSVGPNIRSKNGFFTNKRLDVQAALKKLVPINRVPQELLLLKD